MKHIKHGAAPLLTEATLPFLPCAWAHLALTLTLSPILTLTLTLTLTLILPRPLPLPLPMPLILPYSTLPCLTLQCKICMPMTNQAPGKGRVAYRVAGEDRLGATNTCTTARNHSWISSSRMRNSTLRSARICPI